MDNIQSGLKRTEVSDRHLAVILPVCSICHHVPRQGIKAVMRVGKAWICQACEREILLLEVGSPEYGNMLGKLRSVW